MLEKKNVSRDVFKDCEPKELFWISKIGLSYQL